MTVFLRRLGFWAATVVFPLPLVIVYDMSAREPDMLKFPIVLGLTAYSWWLLAVLLSLRPTWLERVVGLPAVYGLHGMLGVLAVVLAHFHRTSLYAGEALAVLLGDWSFWIALGVLCWSVFFMSGWLVDRVALLLRAKRLVEPVVRHQVSVWVHRLNLAVIAMIWLHAHLLVRVNQYFWFMTLLDAYTIAVLGLYVWKKWIAPDGYLVGVVVANTTLGSSSRELTVRLERPATTLRPGDFFFTRVETPGVAHRDWHPFSVTGVDQSTLTFTIRQNGDHTNRLADLAAGARLRFEGPFGRFGQTADRHHADHPLVLIGMGAGVAPLMSLLEAHHTTRPVHLLWSVRREADAYFRDHLAERVAASDGRLSVTIRVGRFRREDLASTIPRPAVQSGAFFVVGPNPAVLANQRMLRRLGVPARRIHQERLTM
ncbi:FAD-binding oxidoreductase [Curtobacterium flaccumfaciens]|uniref:FAD-binding oxidoreductase n=1 Tax=Curtobacterium flaccumfaciens TaxID=2035 RepID=UPI003F7E4210